MKIKKQPPPLFGGRAKIQLIVFFYLRNSFPYLSILFFFFLNLPIPLWLRGKVCTYNAGDVGSIPGLGRSPGEGKGYPLQYSGLENSMDYTGLQRVGLD